MADSSQDQFSYFKLENGNTIQVWKELTSKGVKKQVKAKTQNSDIPFFTGPIHISTPSNPISDKKLAYDAINFLNDYYSMYSKLKKGTMYLNSTNPYAPLIIEFGGMPTTNPLNNKYEFADTYMPTIFNSSNEFTNNFSFWVAKSSRDKTRENKQEYKGNESLEELAEVGSSAIPKYILYLFSGGYGEGKEVINAGYEDTFDAFYLVDIYIGARTDRDSCIATYTGLASRHPNKVFYFYTDGGAGNKSNKQKLIDAVGPGNSFNCNSKEGFAHMKTNFVAMNHLIQNF